MELSVGGFVNLGDVLSMSVKVERIRYPLACFSGEILVDGTKTAHAGEIKLAFDFYPMMDGANEMPENPGNSSISEDPKLFPTLFLRRRIEYPKL